MDTITLIRSAIRGLLGAADEELGAELRSLLSSGDDYDSSAKPQIDWDDAAAREALINSRANDAFACLAALDGRVLDEAVGQTARLLASVAGQDLEEGDDGVFRIARRVAKDRVISTVDPEARHGHKTAARGFDGYKAHAGVDADSEIITATKVTPANAGDASAAADLIADLLDDEAAEASTDEPVDADQAPDDDHGERAKVYGDAAYGSGEFQATLEDHGIASGCKTPPPSPPAGGHFSKDRFHIDLGADTVACPGGITTPITWGKAEGIARFGAACASCPLAAQCTASPNGRTIRVSTYEAQLARARARQADPHWQADYRATRPKVERKLAHLMRRRHGGRRARVRGTAKIDADFRLLAAGANLARLAVLGLRSTGAGWTAATP